MLDVTSNADDAPPVAAGLNPNEDDIDDARHGRHRQHQSPARGNALKVLYDDAEMAAVRQAAALSGLRPSSYVAAAALGMAEQVIGDGAVSSTAQPVAGKVSRPGPGRLTPAQDRELLAELIQARLAVRRFGVNVNQIAAALNSGASAPVWMERAIAGGERAVARVDEAAALLTRRLSRARPP